TCGARNVALGGPQSAEIDDRIAGLPACEEPLDRRMERDARKLVDPEEAVAANSGVAGRHGLERPAAQVPRKDDVDDVLGLRSAFGGDRVHDGDGTLNRKILVEPDFLGQLAPERVDEALPRVHAAPGKEPDLPPTLLVADQEHAIRAPKHRRDADPRLGHGTHEEPKPRSARSLTGSSSTSKSSISGTGTTTSCATRSPAMAVKVSSASVLRRTTLISPR